MKFPSNSRLSNKFESGYEIVQNFSSNETLKHIDTFLDFDILKEVQDAFG